MKQTSEEISKSRYNTVIKANQLIQQSRFSLSVQQQKMVLYLISQIAPNDEDFREYEFAISDFCRICGMEYNGKNYADIKRAVKDVADKSIWIELEDGKETLVRWIEKPTIEKNSGIIKVRLDKDMMPFLLQLKSNFTKYQLLWTLSFQSKYSIRLYELICSIHYNKDIEYQKIYSLAELRRLLDADTKAYDRYAKFREKVLDIAVSEINRYSDKNITYEPIKTGRSVTHIRLTISSKDIEKRVKLQLELEDRFS